MCTHYTVHDDTISTLKVLSPLLLNKSAQVDLTENPTVADVGGDLDRVELHVERVQQWALPRHRREDRAVPHQVILVGGNQV